MLEKLLRAVLIQVFHNIRSERQVMEQVSTTCWLVGLAMDGVAWVPTVFTKNRERLIRHAVNPARHPLLAEPPSFVPPATLSPDAAASDSTTPTQNETARSPRKHTLDMRSAPTVPDTPTGRHRWPAPRGGRACLQLPALSVG
uniref:Transposase InsH N-terminal domain-containing protein n=1 Tax=Ralstonia syzygii R24 TaxID=907261 RepID=G3AB53_9RALS|nr:hypothetical protein RALSY_mp30051 [Ralstonia syzygii R24]